MTVARNMQQSVRRRLPGEDRRKHLVEEAATLFSEAGFGVSTRQIAQRCGITQAALYKHFPSKDALVDQVFHTVFLDQDRSYFGRALTQDDENIQARITSAYTDFFAGIGKIQQRLFLLATIHGYDLPRDYSAPLDHEILEPLVAQLRIDAGLPDLAREPIRYAERELVLMLHSTIVFLAQRMHIYGIERLQTDAPDIIAQNVEVWLVGARARLGTIWADP